MTSLGSTHPGRWRARPASPVTPAHACDDAGHIYVSAGPSDRQAEVGAWTGGASARSDGRHRACVAETCCALGRARLGRPSES
eukprot:scaffold1437_cov353-Prasinococcus_capsulatus_cf.AAC.12